MPPTPLASDDLSAILGLLQNATLDSSSLHAKPLNVPIDQQRTIALEHLPSFAVDVRAGLQIALFNATDDRDPDGILLRSSEDAFGEVTPPLTLAPERAWLKYRVDAALNASGDPTSGSLPATFDLGASASAVLIDYRVHERTDKLLDVVHGDLNRGTRLALVLADVEALAPGDAVALQSGGTLKLEVKVSWADMFVGELGAFAAATGIHQPIALEFDAGASLTALISVDDHFSVAFSRIDEHAFRVSVRKADQRSFGADVNVGIDVSLAPDAIEPMVNRVLDQLLRRAGLDEKVAALADVAPRIDSIKKKVSDTIQDVVRTKLSAAFSYEYRRVSTTSDVFQATLSASALRTHHQALVRGDLQPILSGILGSQDGITLDRYLHEKSIERSHVWGFTLGIGKWISIGTSDTQTITPVVRNDIEGRRQESYLGLRSYDGKGFADETSWSGEFKAEMDTFSSEPLLTQFALGIHLMWRQQPKRLSEDDVDVFLDAAVIWGVMTSDTAADLRAKLLAFKGRPCDATVQIVITDAGVPALRRTLAGTASAPDVSAALGEAMPWRAGGVGPAVRRNVYAPLWQAYLKKPDASPTSLASSANTFLTDQHFPDLARFELQYRDRRPYTFAGLAELNTDTPGRAQAFVAALATLRHAIETNQPGQPTLDQVFHGLSSFWAQSLHIRAAGVYLIEAARTAQVLDAVKRAATFEVDGKAIVLG